MDTRASTSTRLSLIPIVIALLMNLVIGPLAPILQDGIGDVLAAPETVVDENGANDEPGQKDLTQLTIDYDGLPSTVFVSWNWDDINWSGANTGDGCALFDTDDDLNVDAAICVTIGGSPAQLLDVRLYECTQDAKVDRCTGPVEVGGTLDSTCSVDQQTTDPFPTGNAHPNDTVATCTIHLDEVAAGTAELVNVCSYPSQEPNSDPSDCVLIIRDGALRVIKVVVNDSGGTLKCESFSFTINPGAISESFEADPDCSNLIAVVPGTYSVTEPAVAGYTTSYQNCTNVAVASGEIETCTITNNDQASSLTVTKIVVNDNGGTKAVADFPLFIDGNSVTSGQATTVSAGTHTVSETAATGYTATFGGDCAADGTVTVALGQSKSCTITNDDNAPGLTLVKSLNGGTAAPTDWTLTASGPTGFSGTTPVSNGASFDAGSYDLSESGPAGYTGSSWVCVGGTQNDGDTITLALGENATCTITNTRDTGELTIIKLLDPTDDPGLFDLLVDGQVMEADAGHEGTTGSMVFDTGTYTVSELAGSGTTLADYDSSIECLDGATEVASSDGTSVLVDVTKDADIVCTITNVAVDVALEKEHDETDGLVEPGDIVEYELTVSVNVGSATNVVVTDTLPDGLTYVDGSGVPAPDEQNGQTLKWELGTLAAGTHTITYEASVDADAAGLLKNRACLDADQNPQEICTDTELLVQNVVVTKTNGSEGAVIPGTLVDFALTLDVTNGPIESLVIVDELPDGLTVIDETTISDGGHYDATANTITWMLAEVADGELLTYQAEVSASATAGAYTNVATITDGPCVGDGCDDESTVNVRVPSLLVDKTASTASITISGPNNALVATPSVVTWTLSYTLTSGPVTGAVITDQVPVGFTFLDAANGGTFANGIVTWNLGTLTASGSVTFRTTVNPATISRTGPTVNTATIDSNETAPDQGQDSVTVVVEPPPLAGTPSPKPVLPNTAAGIGAGGEPITVPVELLVAFFIGSLGVMALANVKARGRRW